MPIRLTAGPSRPRIASSREPCTALVIVGCSHTRMRRLSTRSQSRSVGTFPSRRERLRVTRPEARDGYLDRRRRTVAPITNTAPEPRSSGTRMVGAAPVEGVDGVVDVVAEAVHAPVGGLITLLSSVRAPLRARARPPLTPPPT